MSAPIILISGDEFVLRKRALASLLEGREDDDFDIQTFTADSRDIIEWFAEASTIPFLAEKRTVIVRNILRLDSPGEHLARAIKSFGQLPPSAELILIADDEGGDQEKQRRLAGIQRHWETEVKKLKGKIILCNAQKDGVRDALRAEALRLGKKLSPGALQALIAMTDSWTQAFEELEKLSLYVGDAPEIRETDVEAVVSPSKEWSVFALIDAAVAGNVSAAFGQLAHLLASSPRPENVAHQSIFPILADQLRTLWQARVLLDRKENPATARPETKALFPEKGIFNKADWQQSKAMKAASNLSLEQLQVAFELLSDADAKTKGLLPAFGARETLEELVLAIVNAFRPARTATGRSM